jgi:hypothetical protein
LVRIETSAPSGSSVPRSRTAPSIFAATALFNRPVPMAAAKSLALAPSWSERRLPSGSFTVVI